MKAGDILAEIETDKATMEVPATAAGKVVEVKIKVGDKVTIYANPLRNDVELNDGSRGSLYVGVVLSDGQTLGRTDGQGSGSSN